MNLSAPFTALAERLQQDVPAIQSVTRRNLPATAFPPEKQPALVVLEYSATPSGAPVLWALLAVLVLHVRVSGDDQAPGAGQMDLIARVVDALRWRSGEPAGDSGSPWTTLGGLVAYARPEADLTIQDDLDDPAQVSVVMQVSMLAPEDA